MGDRLGGAHPGGVVDLVSSEVVVDCDLASSVILLFALFEDGRWTVGA
jgi:hypothetical protein